MKTIHFLSVLLLIVVLQSCGQTGDLYHPEEHEPIQIEIEES